MPSFLNDENSPIYSPNSGVVHVEPQQHHHLDSLPNGKDSDYRKPFTATLPSANASFDDGSSHSSIETNTTDAHSRTINGDSRTTTTTIMSLPNGKQGNVVNGDFALDKEQQFIPNGRKPLTVAPSEKTMTNGVPPIPRSQSGLSDTQHTRGSVDSNGRNSLQQTPVDTFPSKDSSLDQHRATPSLTPSATTPDLMQRQTSSPHRFSSPPHYQQQSVSSTALQLPGGGLKHRHTLEVPKLSPGRGSKDGGIDAAYASGRFSPTTAGPSTMPGARRTSLSLARRNTRSMHSEAPRDEVVPDEDALRWTEAYRQKRAKKKRKEEEDDDRVIVGTKVDENHANWVTAYNMLTGIRVSVSRTNAKLDRPLTDADFGAKQKSTFDIAGNELVPSAKYDFKFKDYAPWVFRHLRALFRLDPADYLMSLTGKYILSELGSPGKSGSFFYYSRDYKYIIKTIHHAEHKFLRKILKDYYNHVNENPNTLLSQFYGLHRVKTPYGRKIHFVVMNNLFPPHRDIHQTFDLKGSTIGREYKEDDLENNPRATLKDINWLRRKRCLELGIQKKQLFLEQLHKDVRLLQKLHIMDYSLLIGVHDLQRGNEENLRGKTLQVFNPEGVRQQEDEPQSVLMRTPSKLENARKARELRHKIKTERPVPMGQTSNIMPEELEEGHTRGGLFYSDDGGLRATHEDNAPGEEVYYLGVIDCLTHYGMIKKIEHFWKGLMDDRTQISALPPQEYGERFINFMSGITMSSEEAAREQAERAEATAAALTAATTVATATAGFTATDQQPQRANSWNSARRRSSTSIHPPAPTHQPPPPPGLVSPASPEPNPTIEKARERVRKADEQGHIESDVPDRTIRAVRSPHPTDPILPIVEESGETASTGGRSAHSRDGNSRPITPSRQAEGYTELGPHGIGGRGPPTPPKTSYLEVRGHGSGSSDSGYGGGEKRINHRISRDSLDKALPPLPGS